MNFKRMWCRFFGHRINTSTYNGISESHSCDLCGESWSTIGWNNGRLQPATRPAPPMPECKPPKSIGELVVMVSTDIDQTGLNDIERRIDALHEQCTAISTMISSAGQHAAVAKLDISPGDTLVVMVPERISAEQHVRMVTHLQLHLPANTPILVLDGGGQLATVRTVDHHPV